MISILNLGFANLHPNTVFILNKKHCQSSSNFLDLIDKGLVQSFSNLPKLRFLDHPGTSRPRTTFSVATPNRFAGLLSIVAANAEL
jgi:hypothetical protein